MSISGELVRVPSWSYRVVLFLTCLSFFLVQALAEVPDALVHHGHLCVALIQQLLVLLQPAALLRVQLVTHLTETQREQGTHQGSDGWEIGSFLCVCVCVCVCALVAWQSHASGHPVLSLFNQALAG